MEGTKTSCVDDMILFIENPRLCQKPIGSDKQIQQVSMTHSQRMTTSCVIIHHRNQESHLIATATKNVTMNNLKQRYEKSLQEK